MGVSVILNSFSQLFFAVLQAYEDMEIQGLGQVIHMLVMLMGIIAGINLNFDLVGFGFVYLGASIVLVIYSLAAVIIKYFSRRGPLDSSGLKADRQLCITLFKGAFPFGWPEFFIRHIPHWIRLSCLLPAAVKLLVCIVRHIR